MMRIIRENWFVVLLFLATAFFTAQQFIGDGQPSIAARESEDSTWIAPSLYTDNTVTGKERQMIIYGEDLIAHTAKYLGPKGSVLQITNGMNCQNCHLDAGTRPWGNNYSAVFSTYPKMRARSGQVENIYKRINDCFERSLNGKALDTNSYEMQSMYAYIKWLGKDVPKGKKPHSAGLPQLPLLDRPADPARGRIVYVNQCQSCHGANGEGQPNPDKITYAYPPLWGENSYSDGAGLYRITRFASFVKNNMPFNQASHTDPKLTNEEAWDVAAFVNSQPRPHKDQSKDWPDVSKKSIDEPFGPYADGFTEQQHKYGPYQAIEAARKQKKL